MGFHRVRVDPGGIAPDMGQKLLTIDRRPVRRRQIEKQLALQFGQSDDGVGFRVAQQLFGRHERIGAQLTNLGAVGFAPVRLDPGQQGAEPDRPCDRLVVGSTRLILTTERTNSKLNQPEVWKERKEAENAIRDYLADIPSA